MLQLTALGTSEFASTDAIQTLIDWIPTHFNSLSCQELKEQTSITFGPKKATLCEHLLFVSGIIFLQTSRTR